MSEQTEYDQLLILDRLESIQEELEELDLRTLEDVQRHGLDDLAEDMQDLSVLTLAEVREAIREIHEELDGD